MNAADPIARAQADLDDLERNIHRLKAEEGRIASQRHAVEQERDSVRSFITMYDRYASGESVPHVAPLANDAVEPSQPERPRLPLQVAPRKRGGNTKRAAKGTRISRKPESLPTTSDMIREALATPKARESGGFAPEEALAFIQEHYWPGARPADIGPTMWRMWNAHRALEKRGGKYSLPKGATAPNGVGAH